MKYLSVIMIVILIFLSLRGLILLICDIIKTIQDKLTKRRLLRILEDIRKDL